MENKITYCWECQIQNEEVEAKFTYDDGEGSVDLCVKHVNQVQYFGAKPIVKNIEE